MAKRIIQECDLTKHEYDPDETVTITIKKKGKRQGRSYDLSPEAAAKLEQQLVAGSEARLPEGWSFGATLGVIQDTPQLPDAVNTAGGTLEEFSDNIEAAVAQKRAELVASGGITDEERLPEKPVLEEVVGSSNGCRHLNKGRIQTTMRNGRRFVYRKCSKCFADIPEMTSEEKRDYMSGKTPQDVNIRDL